MADIGITDDEADRFADLLEPGWCGVCGKTLVPTKAHACPPATLRGIDAAHSRDESDHVGNLSEFAFWRRLADGVRLLRGDQ